MLFSSSNSRLFTFALWSRPPKLSLQQYSKVCNNDVDEFYNEAMSREALFRLLNYLNTCHHVVSTPDSSIPNQFLNAAPLPILIQEQFRLDEPFVKLCEPRRLFF